MFYLGIISLQLGKAKGVMLIVTESEAEPPGPELVSVKVALGGSGTTTLLPFNSIEPPQPPEAALNKEDTLALNSLEMSPIIEPIIEVE